MRRLAGLPILVLLSSPGIVRAVAHTRTGHPLVRLATLRVLRPVDEVMLVKITNVGLVDHYGYMICWWLCDSETI